MSGNIVIKGARVHNLKNINLTIPRDRLVVITGVSGSGKSSLAFDTLFAEGQRRFLESLAADTRRHLHQLERPDVDSIEGLSPAIAIQQKTAVHNLRSTVGTLTEIYDFLRLLFTRVGQPSCVQCGRKIQAWTIEEIVDQAVAQPKGTRVLVLAPLASPSNGQLDAKLHELAREGFTRVRIGGEVLELSHGLVAADLQAQQVDLVVDRLVLRDGVENRLADSLEIASRWGSRVVKLAVEDDGHGARPQELLFSQKLACVECGSSLPEITPSLFSFNNPHGACPSCAGLGVAAAQKNHSTRPSREGNHGLHPCKDCGGSRLTKASLAITLNGKNITDVSSLSAAECLEFFRALRFEAKNEVVGRQITREITDRLRTLTRVGLEYLTLDRPSVTLSGGEAQRVRLVAQVGSSLAGVLYLLDEPTVGLHQKDTAQLLLLLKQLRASGNSVVVVEHDREVIREADHVVDMGPGAGVCGGEVVAQGTLQEIMREQQSLTGRYLSESDSVPVPERRRPGTGKVLIVKGAREHNLKNITVEFPVSVMTCVTGVSGAGKSSLVMEILYKALASRLHHTHANPGEFDDLIGWECFERVIGIEQTPIGRTPRSNPATYTGLYDHIRKLFAQLPEARIRGYKADRFSFNARAGRCEACRGDGVVGVDMYFLPEVFVTCDVCHGQRYNRETLEIKYKGLNIAKILDLTVSQATEVFGNFPFMQDRLRTLGEVGLGYLRLGQPASTLSGGEAQRVKLARELSRVSNGRAIYILDEPTTGLHFEDIKKLLELLNRLIDNGNTIVVVEHNLDVIKSSDYIVDLGPEGGAAGGYVVAKGTPENVASTPGCATGHFLSEILRQSPLRTA